MNRITLDPQDNEISSMQTSSRVSPATLSAARWLALGAVIGPVLFTLAWLVLGFVSPGYTLWDIHVENYSPISQPISGLGLSLTAPYMNAAFVVGGLLIMVGALGIFQNIRDMSPVTRWSCTVLLALTGLGMMLSGIFTLETILPHTMGFLLGTGTPVLSFLVIGLSLRRIPHWRRLGSWLLVGSPVTLLLLVQSFGNFDPVAAGAGRGVAGLVQRILVTEVLAWIVAMGLKAFRRS
jgi:hypothetical protein